MQKNENVETNPLRELTPAELATISGGRCYRNRCGGGRTPS